MQKNIGYLGYEKARLFAFDIYWPLIAHPVLAIAAYAPAQQTRLGKQRVAISKKEEVDDTKHFFVFIIIQN